MINLDDIKVAAASVTGIGNWMLQIDVILKVAISVATLLYIVLTLRYEVTKTDYERPTHPETWLPHLRLYPLPGGNLRRTDGCQ